MTSLKLGHIRYRKLCHFTDPHSSERVYLIDKIVVLRAKDAARNFRSDVAKRTKNEAEKKKKNRRRRR